jgi:hypothetical protein
MKALDGGEVRVVMGGKLGAGFGLENKGLMP